MRSKRVKQKKSILIIDAHPIFREGLKSIMARHGGYEVVGEAGTGAEGLRMAKELEPDLVTAGIPLPDQNDIQPAQEICSLFPEVRVLIVTMLTKVDYIVEAFQAGATGYIVKESSSQRFLAALDYVSEGKYFLDSSVFQAVVRKLMEYPRKETDITDDVYGALTPREQEIMCLLAEGFSTKKIAERLFISSKTVENHRHNIMSKLGLHSFYGLVRYAVKLGLVDVSLWKE